MLAYCSRCRGQLFEAKGRARRVFLRCVSSHTTTPAHKCSCQSWRAPRAVLCLFRLGRTLAHLRYRLGVHGGAGVDGEGGVLAADERCTLCAGFVVCCVVGILSCLDSKRRLLMRKESSSVGPLGSWHVARRVPRCFVVRFVSLRLQYFPSRDFPVLIDREAHTFLLLVCKVATGRHQKPNTWA